MDIPSATLKPIFVVGSERSGTTLLRLMLDRHPHIAWCYEFEYAVDLVPEGEGWPELTQYGEWLDTHRIFQTTGFSINPELTYPELVRDFLQQKLDRDRKSIVGATVHHNFDKLLRIWPEAKFIHIVRDPRDVAKSCVQMGWAGNVWVGADRWLTSETLWEQLKDEIPAERTLECRYEELVGNCTETLANICEFCGVNYSDEMMSYPQETDYSLPNPKLVQKWRNNMPESDIQLVESRVLPLLKQRGYIPSDLPTVHVSVHKRAYLWCQNRYYRVLFRMRRYGLPLYLFDFVARTLGLREWQKRAKSRINLVASGKLRKSWSDTAVYTENKMSS